MYAVSGAGPGGQALQTCALCAEEIDKLKTLSLLPAVVDLEISPIANQRTEKKTLAALRHVVMTSPCPRHPYPP